MIRLQNSRYGTAEYGSCKNSLLSELYPEILNAETGFIDGTTVNMEALAALNPDVVFYSSGNKELGKQLTDAGYAAIAISANKWQYNAIETLNNWIDLLSQLFPENNKSEKVRTYSESVYNMVQERVSSIPDAEKAKVFFSSNTVRQTSPLREIRSSVSGGQLP